MTESVSSDFVRQVRMALEVLAGQTSISPTDELSPLVAGGGGIYTLLFPLLKNFGASTTTNTGQHFQFDTIDAESAGGEITVSLGTGQERGLITLPQGHVFLCQAYIYLNSITGGDFLNSSWRNNTDAVLFGGTTQQTGDSGSAARTSLDHIIGIIDTSAEAKEIECRQVLRSVGGLTYTGRSWAFISELLQ